MAFLEEYLFWKVAEFLIVKKEYRILQISQEHGELWLERTENKHSQVVRLLHYNLDWSNWLLRDIGMTAENGDRIRRKLAKGDLKILSLYFSAYPPVDDYEFRIAEPTLSENGKVTVESILVDRANASEALSKIENRFDGQIDIELAGEFSVDDVESTKRNALSKAVGRAKEEQSVFNYGKPFFTYLFIAVQVLMFLALEAAGGSTDTSTLIKFGAKFNPLILEGEWWRFFTPIIIHIGLLHLFMNTLALYYLGTMVERLYGNLRFLFIYIISGFSGVLASFIFSPNLSAGASGAIFGCFGALLYFGVAKPRLFWRTLGLNILVVLGINLAFGFTIPGIDNAGHIGGLVGGFATAGIFHLPKKKRPMLQGAFLVVSVAVIVLSLQYGFSGKANLVDERSVLVLAQQHVKAEEYEQANKLLTDFRQQERLSAESLFMLSYTEIKLGRLENAKSNLLQVIEMAPDFHEAYYNLALIYFDEKSLKEAKTYAEKAVELNPGQESYRTTLEQINRYLEEAA
ncbi:rhomboid family intramembrane serine protease [Mesobacillus subterraneus]|uniref:rhomboid family intramembrane serine protease n=1 Tax=Mesobacillus subterraneus TaxID=285983 RepID=UPI0020416B0B|nr:rhomboid family intramembrane serine protease [Mesobacillus subterraneus]MCM3571876.1 rhomboid family intramembrane serine protease [Mesobacillus subterraneus]